MGMQRKLKPEDGNPTQEGVVKPQGFTGELSVPAAPGHQKSNETQGMHLMEQVVSNENVVRALKKLEAKAKSAPGVDGMTVPELRPYLRANWPAIKSRLLNGTYEPAPVKRIEIPKDGGGTRPLGIPTVLERFIQQALLQQLTPILDPQFSEFSFGFRPGRSQHQAVKQAKEFIDSGKYWVVDLDLSKFFDRVNHDMLMARVARKVKDKRVLKLIRRYLEAGVMIQGLLVNTEEGTPQGGPLSPLLSNVMLDDLDKELERRGHAFVRYADDFQVYVSSQRSAERVMGSLQQFIEGKLKLKVNPEKSAIDKAWKRTFLGFSFYLKPKGGTGIRLAPKTLVKAKAKIKKLTSRRWSISMATRIGELNKYLRGWIGYFYLADSRKHLEQLMGWMRRRLRMCLWKQWKHGKTRYRNLRNLGISEEQSRKAAGSCKGYWALSLTQQIHQALGNQYWSQQGLIDLVPTYLECRQQA